MARAYDTIVLGLGAMGSAALQHLTDRGQRALSVEAFGPGHANGSTHGRTRMIRQAYSEGADYIPLVRRAYQLWRELEARCGRDLLTVTGGVLAGRPGSWVVEGAAASAERHGLPFERLDAAEVNARWPAFALTGDLAAGFEPRAGFLDPEACVAAGVALAVAGGAEVRWHERVRAWRADGAGVRVETDHGVHAAGSLVVTAGAWSGRLLAGLGLPLVVWRVYNVFLQPDVEDLAVPERLPVFLMDLPEGEFYGVPALTGEGAKIGRHDAGVPTDPDAVDRDVTAAEVEAVRRPVTGRVPGVAGRVLRATTCLYTLTPDRHFIVDRHPGHAQVVYACGFSGHGFKFAAAIGEALAELVVDGRASLPVGFLSAGRFRRPPGDLSR